MQKDEVEALKQLLADLRAKKHKKDKARIQKPETEENQEK